MKSTLMLLTETRILKVTFEYLITKTKFLDDDETLIEFKNANFSWEGSNIPRSLESPKIPRDDRVTLKQINLKIPRKRLIAVVGRVGSGKSSLLSATLGKIFYWGFFKIWS